MGGTNKKENLILLTPKEHFIAHLLLVYMYSGKEKAKMCYALLKMCQCNSKQKRKLSAKQYEVVRKLYHENCSGTNASFYGKHLSAKTKKNLSKRMKGKNNPSYGKPAWNKGLKLGPLSEERKKYLSKINKGKIRSLKVRKKISETTKGIPKSSEHKKKLSLINLGKKLSQETKLKMSIARKGKKLNFTTCPHCNKKGAGRAMNRWHFDKCKFKKDLFSIA